MKLTVLRYNSENNYTDGLLFIDSKFECHTLEDEYRTKKVYGKTRIPDGTYDVTFRNEGGFYSRYLRKFGLGHKKGMLWVRDVPNFKYILIHIGNTTKDTAGCLLVGTTSDSSRGFIGGSTTAYKKMYGKVAKALSRGEKVIIKYKTIGN